jgi:hypothetical protein
VNLEDVLPVLEALRACRTGAIVSPTLSGQCRTYQFFSSDRSSLEFDVTVQ